MARRLTWVVIFIGHASLIVTAVIGKDPFIAVLAILVSLVAWSEFKQRDRKG